MFSFDEVFDSENKGWWTCRNKLDFYGPYTLQEIIKHDFILRPLYYNGNDCIGGSGWYFLDTDEHLGGPYNSLDECEKGISTFKDMFLFPDEIKTSKESKDNVTEYKIYKRSEKFSIRNNEIVRKSVEFGCSGELHAVYITEEFMDENGNTIYANHFDTICIGMCDEECKNNNLGKFRTIDYKTK